MDFVAPCKVASLEAISASDRRPVCGLGKKQAAVRPLSSRNAGDGRLCGGDSAHRRKESGLRHRIRGRLGDDAEPHQKKARGGPGFRHKKTADSPSGLSGKPLQVLQPLAENDFSFGYSGWKVKQFGNRSQLIERSDTKTGRSFQSRPPTGHSQSAFEIVISGGKVKQPTTTDIFVMSGKRA